MSWRFLYFFVHSLFFSFLLFLVFFLISCFFFHSFSILFFNLLLVNCIPALVRNQLIVFLLSSHLRFVNLGTINKISINTLENNDKILDNFIQSTRFFSYTSIFIINLLLSASLLGFLELTFPLNVLPTQLFRKRAVNIDSRMLWLWLHACKNGYTNSEISTHGLVFQKYLIEWEKILCPRHTVKMVINFAPFVSVPNDNDVVKEIMTNITKWHNFYWYQYTTHILKIIDLFGQKDQITSRLFVFSDFVNVLCESIKRVL